MIEAKERKHQKISLRDPLLFEIKPFVFLESLLRP